MNLRRGLHRLGILLAAPFIAVCIWNVGGATYSYFTASNPQFDPTKPFVVISSPSPEPDGPWAKYAPSTASREDKPQSVSRQASAEISAKLEIATISAMWAAGLYLFFCGLGWVRDGFR
ncbi:hypothetical protein ACLBXM_04925 [Xanthobacteraceae bacterium A53D]